MSKEIDFNNLIYYFRNPNHAPINFINFKGPIHIYNIKNGETSTRKIEGDKKNLKSKLNEITTGNTKYRLKDQLDTRKII